MQTGLALAGGAIPGSACVGVIQALQEEDIKITHIAGASTGSIVAALYAYGLSLEEMKRAVPRLNRRALDFDWKTVMLRLLLRKPHLDGWFKGNRLCRFVRQLTRRSALAAFRIPCALVASDLGSGEPVLFSPREVPGYRTITDWEIATAVRASFAIPVVFQPVRWRNMVLVDGGLLINCPVEVVRAMGASRVLSVDCVSPLVEEPLSRLDSSYGILNRVVNLTLKKQMEEEHSLADLALYPPVKDTDVFDFQRIGDCIEAGYAYTRERMDEIKRVLKA